MQTSQKILDSVHLHLWQQRNFSSDDGKAFFCNDLHQNNIAQLLSVSFAYENNNSLSSVLLKDEICHCEEGSYQPKKKSESFLDIKDCKSLLHIGSNSHINFVKSVISQSSCDSLWLKEIEQNPTLELVEANSNNPSHFSSLSKTDYKSGQQSGQNFGKNPYFVQEQNSFGHSASAATSFQSTSGMPTFVRDAKRKLDEVQELHDEENSNHGSCFKSAREQLAINQKKKYQRGSPQGQGPTNKKSLGSRPRNQCYAKFIPPSNKGSDYENGGTMVQKHPSSSSKQLEETHPKLKGIDPQLVELVMSEIMDHGPRIGWDDIAGLEFAKATIKEIVIWPMLRPDIFTGLRGPPKGILLFGPPGTGKTLIGKCIANQSGATFFSISASSLTSKWIGQAEKMVRALFTVASLHQPAVIFIDEIDSLLSQRSDSEHESSRRIKTEFFVQLDGATTSSDDRILVVGATNRPQEIDEAARRRLVKRLYIPLPDGGAREQIITKLMKLQPCVISRGEIDVIVKQTEGYSGADVTNLCKDAALGPIRSLQTLDISKISKNDVRPINVDDFRKSLQRVRASVSQKDLLQYEEWNKIYGCGSL